MKKFTQAGKKALSVFLAALMVMTAWVFVAPEAKAATAGTYYYKVEFRVTDDMDNVQLKTTLYGRENNGTGKEVEIATKNYTSDTHFKGTMNLMSGTTKAGVFPTRLRVYDNNGARYYLGRNLKGYWSVYAGSSSSSAYKMYLNASYNENPNVEKMEKGDGTDAWWYWEVRNVWIGGKTNTFDVNYSVRSDYYPKASTITMGGGSDTLTVPTNAGGSVSSNAYTATVYDQYGVTWYQDPTFTANREDKVTFSNNKITATNAKSNASSDYTVTVTAKCGNAEKTSTCIIKTFKYKATFYDENGTTVLKATQDVVYNSKATPPENPTKAYDSTNHYNFKTWTPTVGALTTGAQKVDYIATYNTIPHIYTSSVVKKPTCTEKGITKYTCDCGYSYTDKDIPATGHSYGPAATCTTPQTCTVCGAQLKAALGHDFSSKTESDTYLKSAATCVNNAVYYYKCSRCNESSKNHNGTTWTKANSAPGHYFSVKNTDKKYRKSEADCINAAKYYYKCERCDESSKNFTGTTFTDGNALGHSWDTGVVTKEQKCTETGLKKYTCSRCGTTKEEVLPVLGHLWDSGTVTISPSCEGAGVRTFVCQRDSSHTKTESISPNGHTWNTVYTTDKEPTCTEKGSESIHCAKCDAIQAGTSRDIDPIGHDWGKWVTTVKEDCINAGSETRTCKRDSSHTETQARPALGHNFAKEFTVDVAPTCTEKGSKSRHCTRCDARTEVTEIPANGHTYSDWIVDTDSTCYSEGTQHRECTVCHVTLDTKPVEKKNHTWPTDWTITTAATCEEKGRKEKRCTVKECNALLIEEEIPANGHTDGEWIIDKDSSCTETGAKHQICSVCGKTIKTESIPLKDHTLVHEHKDATCTENGYDRNRCSVCNGIFDEKILEKLGHDPKVVSDTQPTCYHDGLYKKVCARENCGVVLETQVRPKLGHIYGEGVKHEADCTKGEYVEYVCTRPGCSEDEPGHIKTEVFSNMQALGHDWTKWTPVKGKEPTCTNVGEEERSCQREGCTAHETRPLSKLGHNMKAGEAVEASCLSGAYTPYTCSNDGCDFSYRIYDDSKPATDHTWVTTTSQEGNILTVTCECSVCHKTHTKEVTVDEVHNYSVVSEIKPATCKEAGKIRITCDGAHKAGCTEYIKVETPANANAHNYVTTKVGATCKQEGYVLSKCSICGNEIKTTLPTTAHAWNKGVETKPATCTETGVKTFTCSICGDTYTEVIAQKQHKFELINTVAPTCKNGGKSGYKVYKCSTCTATYNEITDDAISHNWSDWTVVQKATDKLCGIEESTCSVCGEKQLRTTDPIGDHNFVEDTATKKAATCTEDGSVTMKCSAHTDCGVTYEKVLPKLGHDMVAGEPVAATCEHEGYTDYNCSRGDHSYRIVTEAKKAHTLETKTEVASCLDPSVTYTYCTVCNELMGEVTVGQALGHEFTIEKSYKAPTNTKNGEKVLKCSHCDETITVVIPAQGHKFELVSTEEATCEKTGLETYKCTTHTGENNCGLSYTNVIPMKAHTYATRVKTKPTCTTDGVGECYCSVCNEVFGTYEIPALGHDFSKETANVASTCNSVGYVTKQCSRCDETETTYSSTLGSHKWGDWETVQTADETHPGIKLRKCSVCDLYQYETEPPTGEHDYDDGVVTKQPTCTEPGIKKFTCRRTHCACTPGNEKSYTVEIAPTGHKAKIDKKDATCSEAGYIKVLCTVCGKEIGDHITLEKKEHIYQSTVTIEPTCSKEGVRTYTCALCGDSYTEAIATISHDYQPTGRTVAPTCTTEGFDVYKCTYCGKETFVKTAEKLGHTERTVTIAATCTEKGSKTVVCSVCHTILRETEYTPALGHDWSEWKVTVPGTCAVEGKKTRECSRCHETETISTGTGEHVYPEKGVVTPATCTADGYTTYTCTVCNKYSVIRDYTPKLGHKYSADYKIIVEPTCHSTGTKAHYCVRCGAFEPDYLHNYVELPKLAHTYGEWVVTTEPTCDTNGVKTRTCTGCTDKDEGHTQTELIGKKGHNYGEWEITKKSTCVEEGSQRRYCDRCKTWEVQATPKGGHNRVADYAVEATCTAPGKTAGSHCSICGYVFVAQQEVPMKEHMDLNGDGRCEGCGKTMYSPNGETDSCLCHGTGFRAFIYKIVLIIWKIFKINKNCVCGAKHY